MFLKKGVLKNVEKFTENTCAGVSFLIKLLVSRLELYPKEIPYRRFPVNFVKFLKSNNSK